MSMTKEQKEAIEILEGMVKSYIEADECGLSNNDFKHEIKAMQTVLNMLKEKDKIIKEMAENVLAERKQDKERIKELEAKLEFKKWGDLDNTEFEEYMRQFIPIQKVKNILQKNRNELFSVTYLDDKQYKPFTMQIDRINKIEKELLEDK